MHKYRCIFHLNDVKLIRIAKRLIKMAAEINYYSVAKKILSFNGVNLSCLIKYKYK